MSAELKELNEKLESLVNLERKKQDELDAKLQKSEEGVAELKAELDKVKSATSETLAEKREVVQLNEKMDQLSAAINRLSGATIETKAGDVEADCIKSAVFKLAKSGDMKAFHLLDDAEKKAMSTISDPDGGYMVQNVLQGIKGIQFDTSPVRSVASVATIGGSEYPYIIDDDEFTVSNSAENGSRSETNTAKVGMGRIPVHEKYANIKIPLALFEDSAFDIMGWAGPKAVNKFNRSESTDFVTGAGIDCAKGFTTETVKTSSPRDYARGQVGTSQVASATAVTGDELVTLRGYLKAYYRPNAVWAFNSNTETNIRSLKDGQGNYLWQPNFQMGGADMLLGQRVVIMEDMPDQAANAISIVLADFRECYQIVDKVGISLLDDPYTSKGFRHLFYRKRVGGGVVQWDGIKYIKQAAS